jgi:cytidylate kinase
MIIAIDGPAASGKGTLGKRIAAYYGFAHLDTGKLYRAVARDTLALGKNPTDASAALIAAKALDLRTLADPFLMDGKLGEAASIVASHPAVRQALLAYQRAFARLKPGAVLDGRDIGTVICPDADVKLFVTAAPEERARRRYRELREAGNGISEAEVLADIRRRDERDKNRATAPLAQAQDAVLLDTTNLDIDAAFKAAIDLVDAAMGPAGQAG